MSKVSKRVGWSGGECVTAGIYRGRQVSHQWSLFHGEFGEKKHEKRYPISYPTILYHPDNYGLDIFFYFGFVYVLYYRATPIVGHAISFIKTVSSVSLTAVSQTLSYRSDYLKNGLLRRKNHRHTHTLPKQIEHYLQIPPCFFSYVTP